MPRPRTAVMILDEHFTISETGDTVNIKTSDTTPEKLKALVNKKIGEGVQAPETLKSRGHLRANQRIQNVAREPGDDEEEMPF